MDVLEYLVRDDKWFLGGGNRVIWAPEFPVFLDRPGFWDHACYLNYRVEPLFAITLLEDGGRVLHPRFVGRTWRPSHLTQQYDVDGTLKFTEERTLLPGDLLAARCTLRNTAEKARRVHVVLWSCQPLESKAGTVSWLDGVDLEDEAAVFVRHWAEQVGIEVMRCALALAMSRSLSSYSFNVSEEGPLQPDWRYTPFYEKFHRNRLPCERKVRGGTSAGGHLFIGLHCELTIPGRGEECFTAGIALADSRAEAVAAIRRMRSVDVIEESRKNWRAFFESVPHFECSDPFIQKYYWYRWFGIKLNSITARDEGIHLPYPCVFEGVNAGWFRQHISYSAHVHMLETRWMHDPELAQGSIRNFLHNQRADGSFPGVIVARKGSVEHPLFYHANWGLSVMELLKLHPDRQFLAEVYDGLTRYAEYFDRERDKEGWHLYDVRHQGETGQEYMSRYLFVDEKADEWGSFQLKGVDATVYLYQLQRALAWMAHQLGRPADEKRWQEAAEATRTAVRSRMWHDGIQFFVDVHPKTGQPSPVKAAVGFYPFLTDIAGPEHLPAITRHLFNPDEFWTRWPVPSTSADDPTFSAEGEWKGKRHACPWNGRAWLMTNSYVIEALAQAAYRLDPSLKPKAVELLQKTIRMLFVDGDVNRPSSYEYYNPLTGQAPFFRGTDDYMHSFIVDLIIKYVAGFLPQCEEKVVVDPLPFGLAYYVLRDVPYKGRRVAVTWRGPGARVPEPLSDLAEGLRVYVDGELVAQSDRLERLEVQLA
ncbi:MAG: hypothetical protein IMX00_09740 [Limnochordales bacterium]|nr:hypothetical protein [Limnochordales bacterium]